MRRADRLFQIIQILRRSTLPVTGAALAAELEVSTRTVYRDVANPMAQRVPIMGEAGLAYLLAADYDMPPLMLTPSELEAIVLGTQWVARRGDPLLSPTARYGSNQCNYITAHPIQFQSFLKPSCSNCVLNQSVDDPGSVCTMLFDKRFG